MSSFFLPSWRESPKAVFLVDVCALLALRARRIPQVDSFDLYSPKCLEKLSKKLLSGVSSAKNAVISQRNEPSLLCFVGFYALVLRLARLFRQFL
jgi:hypothetical protein